MKKIALNPLCAIQIFIELFFPFLALCDLQAYVQFGMYHDEWDGTCNVCVVVVQ